MLSDFSGKKLEYRKVSDNSAVCLEARSRLIYETQFVYILRSLEIILCFFIQWYQLTCDSLDDLYVLADVGGVVNVLEPHPHFPFLAVSGLDHDIKLLMPNGEKLIDMKRHCKVSYECKKKPLVCWVTGSITSMSIREQHIYLVIMINCFGLRWMLICWDWDHL